VTYNSTTAFAHPQTLDFYIQGTQPSGFVTPYYRLQRINDYPSDAKTLTFQTTVSMLLLTDSLVNSSVDARVQLPNIGTGTYNGYSTTASYLVWVFGGFPTGTSSNDAIEQGGVSIPISIQFN
jgi:hypothetical protein